MSLRSFLLDDRQVERDAYIWNSLSSGLFALQSLVMPVVAQNRLGEDATGILAIGAAWAFLFGCLGTFGVSRFQASDISRRFSFADYCWGRTLTVTAMWLVTAGFLVWQTTWGSYDAVKAGAIALMVGLKTVDVVEDTVLSFFQQHRRLDIGARACALRYLVTLVVFSLATWILGDLIWALVVTVAAALVSFVGLTALILHGFVDAAQRQASPRQVGALVRACLPMFIAWALTAYINNAPKYAIDQRLDDVAQAHYTFLSTPVFAISLVASFLFNPLIARLAGLWLAGETNQFTRIAWRLFGLITAVGIAAALVGYVFGLPVLSWIFQTDLGSFLPEFMILLAAGWLVAVAGLLSTILTIVRRQTLLATGYALVSVASLAVAGPWVGHQGLFGASLLYLALTGALTIIFASCVSVSLHRGQPRASATSGPGTL